jgi:hypothetical protein
MTEARPEARFVCDTCDRTYPWNPQSAGQMFKCACGQEILVPATPEMLRDGLYDISDAPTPPPPRTLEPAPTPRESVPVSTTPKKVGAGAVAPPVAGGGGSGAKPVSYHRPVMPGSGELHPYFPDKVKDLYLPLWLIGGGAVVQLLSMIISTWGSANALRHTMQNFAIGMVAVTGINLVAILLAARFRGIDFGNWRVAVMKLCAVVIGASAVGALVGTIPFFGGLFGLFAAPIAYFTLMGVMFDLDQGDTWYCVCIAFLVWLAVYGATHKIQ